MRRRIGDWIADNQTDTLARGDQRRKLERRAMSVLFHLADHAGAVVSKDQLIKAVWGDVAISDHSVAIVISQLRKAFEDNRSAPAYIETIPKRGYRLVASVAGVEGAAAAPASPFTPSRLLQNRSMIGVALTAVVALFAVSLLAFQPRDAEFIIVSTFVNNTGSDDQDYLGYALSELIATEFVRQQDVRVRKQPLADDVRRESDGGATVLSGQIFADAGEMLVSVQLIDAASGEILHGQVYPIGDRSIVAAANEITRDASSAIGKSAKTPESQRNYPEEAYTLYWRARYSASFREHDTLRRARDILVSLLAKYPDFVPAHAALADIYAHKTGEHLGLPRVDTFAEAERHLKEARRLAGETGDTAVTAALLSFYRDLDAKAARSYIDDAIRLSPSNPLAWQTKGMIESATGRDRAALDAIDRALALDLTDPSILWDRVWFLYIAGRYQQALDAARKAAHYSSPNSLYLSLIYQALERPEEAFSAWVERARARGLSGGASAAAGSLEDYRKLLDVMSNDPGYEDGGATLAIIRMRAGDESGARSALLEAGPPRESWFMLWARRLPELAPLRSDPQIAVLFAGIEELPHENSDLKKN